MSEFTIDYEARRDHADRLRKIILHSADALPDRVAEYLSEVAEGRGRKAKEQVLKTFVPLVDHLPAAFVDFALRELIEGSREKGWASFHDMTELGIRGAMDYHPPAHVQGPFLRLLRTHEDEGLRLIHGLTNAATGYWCGRERDERFLGYSRTPLPVVLRFPSGTKELWGNEEVYCWFRHTSVAPNAVISALMALEVWMEEQLEAGRDGGELIGKVLAGSQSVAVLGVCVAVALASLSKACLMAVLTALRNPLVWSMDIHRYAKDFQGSPIIDFLGENKLINQHLKDRNQRPQRRREVRHLIPLYLFSGDDELRLAAERAFAGFGEDQPLPFEEAAASEEMVREWRTQVERYRDHLRRERYRRIETSEWVGWQYQQAEELADEANQELAGYHLLNDLLGLDQWATKTLKEDTPPDVAVMEQMVRSARAHHRPDDFREPIGSDPGMDSTRQQAVVAVAAAVAAKCLDWARQQGHAGWCRAVLLAAACSPRSRGDALNRRNVFHLDHKLNAARGLTALVAQGAGEAEVRYAVLGLVLDSQLQVVQTVFEGLRKAWGRDEVLCWNCLGLALSFAVVPGNTLVPGMGLAFNEAGIARVEALWQEHAANLEEGRRPILPLIEVDDRGFFLWDLAGRALQGLPLEELMKQPEAKAALLPLADALLGWTISENMRGSDDDDRPRRHSEAPWEWNHFFLGWLADLARHLTPAEAESHVLAPVRATWPRLPRLTADLLHGLFQYQVARLPPQEPPEPQAVRTWEQVCRDLLGRAELARRADEDYLSGDWSSAVTMMVFVNHGMYLLKEEWQHVRLFSGIIDRWLEVVGTNHEAYRAFLTMLVAAFRHFSPAQVVGWLCRVASRSEDVRALWGANNGERTARVLHAVWQASSPALMADAEAFRQFSGLVDRLAVSGVALASVIQQELEGRGGY